MKRITGLKKMQKQAEAKLTKIMNLNAAIIVQWAKDKNVTLQELMTFISTPEGYQKLIEMSTKYQSIMVKNNLI